METIATNREKDKKATRPKRDSGVKKLVLLECSTPDFLIGKNDCPPHVVINSKEDGGFLRVHVPKDGYYRGTKSNQIACTRWILKPVPPGGPAFIKEDAIDLTGNMVKVTMSRKLCGSALYWLEAFLHSPENKAPLGFFFSGYCMPRITKVTWHEYQDDNNGPELTRDVSFGDMLQLHIETEGLNGDILEVTFIGDEADEPLEVVKGQTFQGRLIINFPVKTIWKSKYFNWFENTLSFNLNITVNIINKRLNTNFSGAELSIKNKITERKLEKGNAVPVTIGKVEVDAKKYEMCKYTGITVKTKDRNLILFDQNNPVVTLKNVEIIAGSKRGKREVIVELKEFRTDDCRLKNSSHVENKVSIMTSDEPPIIKTIDGGQIKFDAVSSLSRFNLYPFQYLWPTWITPKEYNLVLETCRYRRNLAVLVYPDIEWTMQFYYNSKNPVIYRDTWTNMTKYRVSDAVNKAQAGDIDGYDGKLQMEFGFKLKAEWDDKSQEAEIGKEWAETMKNFVSYFIEVRGMINSMAHADKVDKSSLAQKLKNRLLKKPITLEILAPGISFDIGWKFEEKKKESGLGTIVSGKIKCDPLIGGKGRLDLFAVGSKAPGVGQVITALDLALSAINVDPVFDLNAKGEISIEGDLEFNTTNNEVQKSSLTIAGKFGLEVVLSVKAEGKLKGLVLVGDVDYSLEATAKAESYFIPTAEAGVDDEGVYVETKLDFTGIKAVGNVEMSAKGSKLDRKVNYIIVKKKIGIITKKHYLNNDKKN